MKRDNIWMILGVAVMFVLFGIVGGNDLEDRTAILTVSMNTQPYIP